MVLYKSDIKTNYLKKKKKRNRNSRLRVKRFLHMIVIYYAIKEISDIILEYMTNIWLSLYKMVFYM